MTDITELAQREKFEAWAEERCALPWGYLKNRRTNTGYFSKHDYTSLWSAWKAAGAELVEALEKSEKTSEARREAIDRTHNMFVRERDRANVAEEALEKAQTINAAPAILRQLAEEKQKRGEVAAATAFNYAASALQKELSK